MGNARAELLTKGLKEVSRSFYLTLRVLPSPVRDQIGLAYLLARTTDTIADTELLPVEQRLSALEALSRRIQGTEPKPLALSSLIQHQVSSAERRLLENTEFSLSILHHFDESDRTLIREVLHTITSGQVLDLQRFGSASKDRIIALQTYGDLDDYTYRVAGCVGEFWTRMCRRHLFPSVKMDEALLLENGIRFGKGLQLINILRDLAKDLRQGRCYLPEMELSKRGLSLADLLNPLNESKVRPLYHQYLDLAEAHLRCGWSYTNSVPWAHVRVRLACAWPILIGMETIHLLRSSNVLADQVLKVNRKQVRRVMIRSIYSYPVPGVWRRLLPK